jgi:predicted nucleic acid-binding protein
VNCVDSSVIIAWLNGADYPEAEALDALLEKDAAFIAPIGITEIFSDTKGGPIVAEALTTFRVLDLKPGYWERAGAMRAELRREGRKAPIADALIAQAAIDADLPLLTRDADFRIYAKLFGLKLA